MSHYDHGRMAWTLCPILILLPINFALSAGEEIIFTDGFESPLPVPSLYLPFDGDTSDHSPNGTDGTNTGATLTTDENGNPDSAYFFNGTGTEIFVPDADSLDVEQITLSFWFNMASTDTARELVNKFGTNGDISFGTEFSATGNTLYFRVSTTGTTASLTDLPAATAINTDTWYHFTGTYDGSEMVIYLNGMFDSSVSKTGAIFNSTASLRVGRYGFFPGWVFHGTIDEVIIWDRALSSQEVALLYANDGRL